MHLSPSNPLRAKTFLESLITVSWIYDPTKLISFSALFFLGVDCRKHQKVDQRSKPLQQTEEEKDRVDAFLNNLNKEAKICSKHFWKETVSAKLQIISSHK